MRGWSNAGYGRGHRQGVERVYRAEHGVCLLCGSDLDQYHQCRNRTAADHEAGQLIAAIDPQATAIVATTGPEPGCRYCGHAYVNGACPECG
jgi:hypothetical protein